MKSIKFGGYDLKDIISTFSEEAKQDVLKNQDLIINKLHLSDYQVSDLVKGLSNEEIKKEMIDIYELPDYLKMDIIKTFSDSAKVNILLENNSFRKYDKIQILETLDSEALNKFLLENKEFCKESDIRPYEIVCKLNNDKQTKLVTDLEDLELTLNEKREILATLNEDVKKEIDVTNFPDEYKSAINMKTDENGKRIVIDFDKDPEDYRGLDNLLLVNPEEFTEEMREKFAKICNVCPNLQIVSILNDALESKSTVSEYKEAEEWIDSLIQSINPEYSKAQKMAIIDNAIGKKISYSPDFETEVFDQSDCRALWKIISSGYGVCNGIAKVEKYILDRVGIESEIIGGNGHAFLKVKDIELPLANGETKKGNTILDPTWNLTSHRFGGKPENFCLSYDDIRKNDIDDEGKDHECHKNDEKLEDANLSLDEKSLRKLFSSVELADKDGNFPIKDLIENSKMLDEVYANSPEENINKQFILLKKTCPEFAKCQNSSMRIINDILLANENLEFDKCVINRVYNKADQGKNPLLFVYINSEELGDKFYLASKEDDDFVPFSKQEFEEKYECYETDLEKHNRS